MSLTWGLMRHSQFFSAATLQENESESGGPPLAHAPACSSPPAVLGSSFTTSAICHIAPRLPGNYSSNWKRQRYLICSPGGVGTSSASRFSAESQNPLTHPLTHSSIHSLIHSLAHSVVLVDLARADKGTIPSVFHPPTCPLICGGDRSHPKSSDSIAVMRF